MNRTLMMAIGLGVGMWALPASAKPSNFQQSCTSSKLAVTNEKVVLKATCMKLDGRPMLTSLEIKGIANMPAGLQMTSGLSSTFQNSCTNIAFVEALAKITATCQDGRGGTRAASIVITDVENIDGVLKYTK